MSSRADEAMTQRGEQYGEALSLALRFMPWVSKSRRAQEIAETKLPDDVKTTLTQMAGEAPDWSAKHSLASFFDTYAMYATGTAGALPPSLPLKSAEGKDQAAE